VLRQAEVDEHGLAAAALDLVRVRVRVRVRGRVRVRDRVRVRVRDRVRVRVRVRVRRSTMRMPGCGSALKTPSTKTCCAKAALMSCT